MDSPDLNPLLPNLIGSGIAGLVITIVVVVIAFVISAFIASIWVRLIITFMRGTLDREYRRMASAGFTPPAAPTQHGHRITD